VCLELLEAVVASGLVYVAALAEQSAVVAEVAERAPPAGLKAVAVARPARAHGFTACTLCAMTLKRWVIVGGSVLAALMLATVILLIVLVAQNNQASERERYDRAREYCEELLGPVTADNLDEYAECADRTLNR
jgi:uncharacterized membrane protein